MLTVYFHTIPKLSNLNYIFPTQVFSEADKPYSIPGALSHCRLFHFCRSETRLSLCLHRWELVDANKFKTTGTVVDLNFPYIVKVNKPFPASTVSSQILLTQLFLLLANLPGLFGAYAFCLTLLFLPPLFSKLRFHILPRCLSNLTHATDLCVYKRENPIQKVFDGFFDFGAFIQSLQLQSSKVSALSIVLIL